MSQSQYNCYHIGVFNRDKEIVKRELIHDMQGEFKNVDDVFNSYKGSFGDRWEIYSIKKLKLLDRKNYSK